MQTAKRDSRSEESKEKVFLLLDFCISVLRFLSRPSSRLQVSLPSPLPPVASETCFGLARFDDIDIPDRRSLRSPGVGSRALELLSAVSLASRRID